MYGHDEVEMAYPVCAPECIHEHNSLRLQLWHGQSWKFSRVQLKLIDTLLPILKRIERVWPWSGTSIIGIGIKE